MNDPNKKVISSTYLKAEPINENNNVLKERNFQREKQNQTSDFLGNQETRQRR